MERLSDRAHPLTGHLDDAELAHAEDLGLGPVVLEIVVKPLFQLAAVPLVAQVDEVADDDAAQIAKRELPGDFVGRFHVGLEGGGLGVAVIAKLSAVDVDRHDCFGGIDDQRAAAGKRDVTAVHQLDVALDSEFVKQRDRLLEELDLIFRPRIRELNDLFDPLGDFLVVHHDRVDLAAEEVANGPRHQIAFGVQLERSGAGITFLFKGLPEAREVGQVALDLGFALPDTGGANDEADVLGRLERVEDLPEAAALFLVFNLAAIRPSCRGPASSRGSGPGWRDRC